MSDEPIIVVGGGQAGLQISDSLRRGGFTGPVHLYCEESCPPYQRPPLSKQYITQNLDEERLALRGDAYFEKQGIDVIRDAKVSELRPSAREVVVDDAVIKYQGLAIATGARARPLPVAGADLKGVYYLRTLADARAIRASLAAGKRHLVAIGGGFIGLEMAAAARELNHDVTVVEAQDRLMARVVSATVSDYYLNLHRERGVEVILGAQVAAIEATGERALTVKFADGLALAADMVVVGIGSIPCTELAEAAGLACDNGILVDEFAQTADGNIVAAGDCTMHTNAKLGVRHRLESVQNAVDQAKVAAASLLGSRKAYEQIPWFWSDQFDVKLQMVGTSVDHDDQIVRGSIADGAYSVFYYLRDALIGVDSINRPSDHLLSRKLISAETTVPKAVVADANSDLKSLL